MGDTLSDMANYDKEQEIQAREDKKGLKQLKQMLNLQDGGTRKTYSTGAQKEDDSKTEGKGAYHLLPQYPIRRVAEIYRLGAQKYSPFNWMKGLPLSRLLDSAMRHTAQFAEGMEDEDHLHMAIWNLMGLSWTLEQIKRGKLPEELNDLWSEAEPGEAIEVRPGYVCSQWRGKGKVVNNG